MQLRRISIDPQCARAIELIFPVPAAQQPHAEHSCPPSGKQIPDGVPGDIALMGSDLQARLAREKQIWLWLRSSNITTIDDDSLGCHAESIEGPVYIGPPPG